MLRVLSALTLLAFSMNAAGQQPICPNLTDLVANASFPMAAILAGLPDGKALVEFTVLPEGEVADPRVLESTHPAFAEEATTIVRRLRCEPRQNKLRTNLAVNFVLPRAPVDYSRAPDKGCAPTEGFADHAAFPKEAANLGLKEGSALVTVTIASDGKSRTYRVDKATHPAFAAAAVRAASFMACRKEEGETSIQVPFTFRLE